MYRKKKLLSKPGIFVSAKTDPSVIIRRVSYTATVFTRMMFYKSIFLSNCSMKL